MKKFKNAKMLNEKGSLQNHFGQTEKLLIKQYRTMMAWKCGQRSIETLIL